MHLYPNISGCWLVWCVMFVLVLTQDTPQPITVCSCRYKNKTYDLSPLAMTNQKARFKFNRGAGYLYSYNPCLPFTLPNQTGTLKPDNCTDVAICYWSNLDTNLHNAYGHQDLSYIKCVLTRNGNLALEYRRGRREEKMYSYVEFICNKSQTDVSRAFKLVSGTTEPVFQVIHSYSCPREPSDLPEVLSYLQDTWFWIVVGESTILILIIITVGTIIGRRRVRPPPDPNDEFYDPLIQGQENPENDHANLIDHPDGFNIDPPEGFNVEPPEGFNIDPPEEFNVEPPEGFNVEPADGFNVEPPDGFNIDHAEGFNVEPPDGFNIEPPEGFNIEPPEGFNIEPQREEREGGEQVEEPLPQDQQQQQRQHGLQRGHEEPYAQPGSQNSQPEMNRDGSSFIPENQRSQDGAHQSRHSLEQSLSGSNRPVERDASDEDSFNNNWRNRYRQISNFQNAMLEARNDSNLLSVPEPGESSPHSSPRVPRSQRAQDESRNSSDLLSE